MREWPVGNGLPELDSNPLMIENPHLWMIPHLAGLPESKPTR